MLKNTCRQCGRQFYCNKDLEDISSISLCKERKYKCLCPLCYENGNKEAAKDYVIRRSLKCFKNLKFEEVFKIPDDKWKQVI